MMKGSALRALSAAFLCSLSLTFPAYAEETGPAFDPALNAEGSAPVKAGEFSADADASGSYLQGQSLGWYVTTGYCGCSRCSGDSGAMTYSGVRAREGHTLAADLNVFPLGTLLMINGTVYTVEDTGVGGNMLDIYYETHAAALEHGLQDAEVFAAIPIEEP